VELNKDFPIAGALYSHRRGFFTVFLFRGFFSHTISRSMIVEAQFRQDSNKVYRVCNSKYENNNYEVYNEV